MLIQLLDLLQSGRTYSVQDLSELLKKDADAIKTELEYLEAQGYIRKVSPQVDCSHHCSGCHGCDQSIVSTDMKIWEVIRRNS